MRNRAKRFQIMPITRIGVMKSGDRGFSMVELVVTVAVSAIVAGMMARLLSAGVDTYKYVTHRKDALYDGRIAVQRMAREIRQIASSDSILFAEQDSLRFYKQGGESISLALNGTTIDLNGQPLIESIRNFQFQYYSDKGKLLQTPVFNRSRIWKIGFKFTIEIKQQSMSFSHEIKPRNF